MHLDLEGHATAARCTSGSIGYTDEPAAPGLNVTARPPESTATHCCVLGHATPSSPDELSEAIDTGDSSRTAEDHLRVAPA